MASIQSFTLGVPDPAVADAFYRAAFDLGPRLNLRTSDAPTSGFRAFTVSLVVSQPATVDEVMGSALDAGATSLKPATKQFWGGYSGVVQAPDGTIWKLASPSKKNAGPATREIDEIVLLLGAADFVASKRFYVDHGLEVSKSVARAYVEFAASPQHIKLGLYKRRALARMPASPLTAPDHTASRSSAMPGPSPPRTGSRGKPPSNDSPVTTALPADRQRPRR
jgi:hypothetical protein